MQNISIYTSAVLCHSTALLCSSYRFHTFPMCTLWIHHTSDFLWGRAATLCTLLHIGTASATTPSQAQLVPKPLFTAWSPLGAPRPMTPEGRQHFPPGCRPSQVGCRPLLLNSSALHSLHTIHVLSHRTRPVLQARRFLQMETPVPMLPACRKASHSCRAIQMLLSWSAFMNPHWAYLLWSSPYLSPLRGKSYSHICALSGDCVRAWPTAKPSCLKSQCCAHEGN